MSQIFDEKTVLITGCNRGIGKDLVNMFASHGANIIAHSRSRSDDFEMELKEIGKKLGVKISPAYFDLKIEAEIDEFTKELFQSKIVIDILVNNAGITHNSILSMSKNSELREQFDVNFFSVVHLTKQVSRIMMKQRKGNIINISSTAAIDGNIGKSLYGSSKGALNTFTKVLSRELGPYGIRVNAIAPGMTETDMLNTFSSKIIEDNIERTLTKRLATTNDIANAVMFLASDLSSYITGQVIRVDGGLT